jgi:two-component system response regulator GlrR
MEEARVFILDLNPRSGLRHLIKGILESSQKPHIRVYEGRYGVGGGSAGQNESRSDFSSVHPNLIILLLGSNPLSQTSEVIQSLHTESYKAPVIAVFEGNRSDDIIELLKLGVVDFITPPLRSVDLLPRIWRILEWMAGREPVTETLKERIGIGQLVGKNPAFLAEIGKIPLVARCDAMVLISGETGTGKELFARAIHYLSRRSHKPYIPVDCGAIPPELIENELFGHVKGAFTGADASQAGLIREAEGGTIFLDEIDCLSPPAQVKLLRLLQEREYRQLGAPKFHKADIRVMAATNIDLQKWAGCGKFRKDLYYRLNVVQIVLPPLRDRRDDVPLLARHFLDRHTAELGKEVGDFSPDALQSLVLYDWPGNIRELEHVVERAVIFSEGRFIQKTDIRLSSETATADHKSFKEAKRKVVEKFERDYIQGLLSIHGGNIARAARAAQKDRRAFWELMRKYGIESYSFVSGH